jgi:hypothetical protein
MQLLKPTCFWQTVVCLLHLIFPMLLIQTVFAAPPVKIFETDRNSANKPVVRIRLTGSPDNADLLVNEYTFSSEKGFLGPSSDPTNQSGFANSENTVFGVSYEPVTKACFVKLFLLNSSGTLVFVNNVNHRVANVLHGTLASNAREFLRIEKIVDRHIYLRTADFSHGDQPSKEFRVTISTQGTITRD